MSLDDVIGQSRPKRILRQALRSGRLAHAYLFHGPEGVGKEALALELAKLVNCDQGGNDACDLCPSCRKISKFRHPDVRLILPAPPSVKPEQMGALLEERAKGPWGVLGLGADGSISIESIRGLRRDGAFRPFEGKQKVAIIAKADRMTVQAANALLKTLEEPPNDMLLVLTSARPHGLLPTIVSRCQQLRFGQLQPEEIEEALVNRFGIESAKARLVGHLSGGSFKRAAELLDGDVNRLREEALGLLRVALSGNNVDILETVERIWQAGNRESIQKLLQVLLIWFGDLFLLSESGEKSAIANIDRLEELQAMIAAYQPDQIERWISSTEDILDRLIRNVNPKLALTALLLRIESERSNPDWGQTQRPCSEV